MIEVYIDNTGNPTITDFSTAESIINNGQEVNMSHDGNTELYEKLWEEEDSNPDNKNKSYKEKMEIVNKRFEIMQG